jgi:1-acyl-sn-glycerol-3-phosphate acyltransferase
MKKNTLISLIVSIWIWFFFLTSSVPLLILVATARIINQPFGKRLGLVHRASAFWARTLIIACPFWKVSYFDLNKMPRRQTCMLVSNHQSLLDILVLYRVNRQFKWVSKVENFKTPIIGWVLHLNRYLKIERGRSASANKLLADARHAFQYKSSLMVFPEGTRSLDGTMKSFKDGAFLIAKENNVPVVPIMLDGNYLSLPKHGLLLKQSSHIVVRILDPIPVELVRQKSVRELAALCHDRIETALDEHRKTNVRA